MIGVSGGAAEEDATMTNAAIKAMRDMAANYETSRLTVTKTDAGWEARKGGRLVGVCQTREGAKELLGAI